MKFDTKIELCEIPDEEVAGRAKIKMSALKVSSNDSDNNDNGINWVKDYVKSNIKSMIGASYKVAFIDDDKTYPSGHGSMEYDEDGNVIFPDSDTVGSIQDAYINTVDIDGDNETVLTTEGFIYKQSYPNFYNWLKEESENGTIYGSVEINGKGTNKSIIYEGESKDSEGNPKIGRKPKIFDFTALAILSDFVPPADKYSRVFEVNSKEGNKLKKIKSTQKIEINELSYDDIATIVTRAFNTTMRVKEKSSDDYYFNYWIYKFYPTSGTVIMRKDYEVPNEYYMTTYKIANNDVVLGDILEVEMNWKPINNESEVEINTSLIKDILEKQNKEVILMEDNKVILELNQKIENKTTEINELTTKNAALNDKTIELNEAVVNANKALEEANLKISALTEELNSCNEELGNLKTEKEQVETEKKTAEVNSYFENEIPKNGFAEEEVNSLKHFVDEIDLTGLKNAESELCAKKFKEMMQKNTEKKDDSEINSASSISFITIHEKEKKSVGNATISFFN